MWNILQTLQMVLIASQANASANWVVIGTVSGHTISIAMNDIPKGTDGIVYFENSDDGGDSYTSNAVDCQRGVMYVLGGSNDNIPDWRDHGYSVKAGSAAEAEMQIVCAKAGTGPLPGYWVEIGFGLSIDKDTILRGSDGLVHFTTFDHRNASSEAADCQRRLIYFGVGRDGWRDRGDEVGPNSFAEAELNYACASVR